jgi:hemimethylated DNA binding protein
VPALVESSDSANDDLLVFFYCQDLEQRLQRALNTEQYVAAQKLRGQLDDFAAKLRLQTDAKRARGGRASRADAEAELTSRQARVAVLKSQMSAAAAEERYSDAAKLRDAVAVAELALLSASAAVAAAGSGSDGAAPAFALGQRVEHSRFGWQGVVCGVDPRCGESDAWAAEAGVDALSRGREQPFYVVLPDANQLGVAAVLYCAEELLRAPPLPRGAPVPEAVEHPYTYLLFLGPDAAGGHVPTRAMRDRYSAPRRDVHPPESAEDEDDAGGDA